MRLRTNIFLWVALASVVPLTALALGALAYSELLYRRGIERELASTLGAVAAELDRRLLFERELVLALARSPTLRAFEPVLERAARGDIHPDFFALEDRVNAFLEAFQAVVPGLRTVRVLDLEGNALVRVRLGRRTEPVLDGYEAFPFAEEADDPERLAETLARLPPGEVSFLRLPASAAAEAAGARIVLLDAVVPLAAAGGRVLGYLAVTLTGEALDRILDLVPRPHGATLVVAELDPDDPARDGRLLYADHAGARFAVASAPATLGEAFPWGEALRAAVGRSNYGAVRVADGTVHFLEHLPYPDQLLSWVIAYHVPAGAAAAPFTPIRLAVPLFALVALALALLIGRLGARQVAGPVAALARGLRRYAAGERDLRLPARGAEEIRELVRSFNDMAETLARAEAERDRARAASEAQARLASLGRLAAGIGHELNNPLGNILSLVRLAERGLERGEDPRADLAAIRDEALRASRIVQGVLDFARRAPPRRAPFDAREWLEETVRLVAAQARRRGVRVEPAAAPAIEVVGDRGQLQQALLNLLLNAVQASPEGGRVRVEATVTKDGAGRRLEVRVLDEGPGLAPEALERAFEPFYTTKPVGEGTGLGLAIAHGIVERHGGRIVLRNREGGGAEARIALPLDTEDGSDAGRTGEP